MPRGEPAEIAGNQPPCGTDLWHVFSRSGRHALVLIPLLLSLGAAACGAPSGADAPQTAPSTPPPATAAATSYPLTIDNCGRTLTFTQPPSRVVLLNGTSVAEVESFVVLGIQDRILANSQSYGVSDEPGMVERVKAVPTGGLTLNQNFEVPREQVLALKPDLVISTWAGGFDEKIGSISRDQLAEAGIASFVTPVNCAFGDPRAPEADQERYLGQSIESSFELLLELGRIFDVQQRAADYVNEQRTRISEVEKRVAGQERRNALIVYPGMSMMNNNGLPAVFGGGIYDDIVRRAGGVNPFAGRTFTELAEINAEALASAKVDLLVVGLFQSDENPEVLADDLFAKFPQWAAAEHRRFTSLSDGCYLGPLNAVAVARIADAAHG
ncbi:iron complex transport system substrate-binding protein [Goodfellowiella coeruleoviolacea]|uniref:Iron complex transport system substrate-binding protein n=1 Tax=Goodfellowiella coeruleoviolacea TaxID=334858 RepID=A0AAE3GGG0_9PSEU|nr:iron complex transport system substrate-binding protein [Goodfellowiella coeruleoviolacea]